MVAFATVPDGQAHTVPVLMKTCGAKHLPLRSDAAPWAGRVHHGRVVRLSVCSLVAHVVFLGCCCCPPKGGPL